MDAWAPESIADRRPTFTRLAAALRQNLPKTVPAGLCLPICLLFARHFRFEAADPAWPDRDRLVLAPALAPLGEALGRLTQLGEPFGAAPGPAFGIGVGAALAERLLAARFGRSLVDHRSWVVCADTDLANGAAQEAAQLAGLWRLGRLTALVSMPGKDAPGLAGFAAAGWSVRRVGAADAGEIAAALSAALRSQKPTLIACVGGDEPHEVAAQLLVEVGLTSWADSGRRLARVRRSWLKRLARHASRREFENAVGGRLPLGWHTALLETGAQPLVGTLSTAETLRRAVARLAAGLPDLAVLPGEPAWKPTGNTAEPGMAQEAAGRLAQGVSAAMAGMSLHGGMLPVVAQCLEAEAGHSGLREAAFAGLRIVQCLVEPAVACPVAGRRAALRAMRNLTVFRPADASEALECAEIALRRAGGPSVLLLSETPVPLLAERPTRTRCAKGGYVLAEASAPRAVTLIASGIEVHAALEARLHLAGAGVAAAVVSLPCWGFFGHQEPHWQEAVLGDAPRVGIEAGSGFGWDRWLGPNGLFIGAAQAGSEAASVLTGRLVANLVLRHLGYGALA